MATQTVKNSVSVRLHVGLLIAAAAVFFIAFSVWSGVPPGGEKALPFWIGVVILLIILAAFGFMTWHLLFRALPSGQVARVQTLAITTRQSLALLLTISGLSIIIGLFWDEVWHRRYGFPLCEDFFWRPHLLMYFGFGSVTALAFIGLYIISRGKGTFQQRFRASPLIGLLILLGAFLMYVLTADPLWHSIYGEDLTAWGVPHLILISSFVLILLMALTLHMTAQPPREWGFGLRRAAALPFVIFATIFLVWNQFWITEYDSAWPNTFERPVWLLHALIAGGPAFIGLLAITSLRQFGAATLSGVFALAVRALLIALFGVQDIMYVNAWILALPMCLAVDLAFVMRRLTFPPSPLPAPQRGGENASQILPHSIETDSGRSWIFAGAAAAGVMSVLSLTLMPQFYPSYPVTSLPLTILMLLVGCLATAWIGARVGTAIANGSHEGEAESVGTRWPLYSFSVVLVVAVFVVYFVASAAPPR